MKRIIVLMALAVVTGCASGPRPYTVDDSKPLVLSDSIRMIFQGVPDYPNTWNWSPCRITNFLEGSSYNPQANDACREKFWRDIVPVGPDGEKPRKYGTEVSFMFDEANMTDAPGLRSYQMSYNDALQVLMKIYFSSKPAATGLRSPVVFVDPSKRSRKLLKLLFLQSHTTPVGVKNRDEIMHEISERQVAAELNMSVDELRKMVGRDPNAENSESARRVFQNMRTNSDIFSSRFDLGRWAKSTYYMAAIVPYTSGEGREEGWSKLYEWYNGEYREWILDDQGRRVGVPTYLDGNWRAEPGANKAVEEWAQLKQAIRN